MKSCLIVIDIQQSFRHRPYSTEHDIPAYLAAQNALTEGCMARGLPVGSLLHWLRGLRLATVQVAQTMVVALQSGRNVTQAAGMAGFSSDTQLRRAWHQFAVADTPSSRTSLLKI